MQTKFNPIPAGVLENQETLGGRICKKISKFPIIDFFAKSSQKKCPKLIIYAFLKSP